MASKGNKRRGVQEDPHYPLDEVKQLISDGRFKIPHVTQLKTRRELGWTVREVTEAILMLTPQDFHKRDQEGKPPWGVLDFYKPKRKIKGELVYIHFSINDEDFLIIDSCHKQERSR